MFCAMTFETRANLVFLVLFLLISLPGAAILFVKKLDPTARRMSLPEPVRKSLPYMDPMPVPPEVPRVVPPRTAAWVDAGARDTAGLPAAARVQTADGRSMPWMSRRRWFQVIGFDGQQRLWLLLWAPQLTRGGSVEVTAGTADGQRMMVVPIHTIAPIPREVRRELQDEGFVRPPEQVMWVALESGAVRPGQLTMLSVSFGGASDDVRLVDDGAANADSADRQ
jgi:hypothetical protein